MVETVEVGRFTIGLDVKLVIVTPDGVLQPMIITSFESRVIYTKLESNGLDGVCRHALIPKGWSGHFYYDRGDAVLDRYFADLEAYYHRGGALGSVVIFETITNPDQTISKYRFEGVVLALDEAGSYAGDVIVKPRVSFQAARRIQVT